MTEIEHIYAGYSPEQARTAAAWLALAVDGDLDGAQHSLDGRQIHIWALLPAIHAAIGAEIMLDPDKVAERVRAYLLDLDAE